MQKISFYQGIFIGRKGEVYWKEGDLSRSHRASAAERYRKQVHEREDAA